jgi:hypothetical protein
MRFVPVVLLAVMLGSAVAEAAVRTGSPSGLRGVVMQGPTRPVCTEFDPCERPAVGLVLQFKRVDRVVAQVRTRAGGAYVVRLRPGTYVITTTRRGIGKGITPRLVKVPSGRFARVNLHLDTGIQ